MLTLYQFNALPEAEQIDLLEREGVYLEVFRYADGCKIALFAYGALYVEVWLQERRNKIQKLNAFTSLKRLDLYLHQIAIPPLLTV